MSLIDLYINDCGTIRRIGDNCHDQLTIDEDGRLRYYNLQNGDGCTLGVKREHDECFYEFVPNVDEYGFNCDPREADTPQNEETCKRCVYVRGSQWCQGCNGTPKRWNGEKVVDTPQTDKLTEEEFDTMIAKGLLGQTDCQW